MKRVVQRCAFGIIMIGGLLAIASAVFTRSFAPSALAAGLSACEIQCWNGPALLCNEGQHYAFDDDEYRNAMRYGGVHSGECRAGGCDTMHGSAECIPWMAGENQPSLDEQDLDE
jgi:hypothetical protein